MKFNKKIVLAIVIFVIIFAIAILYVFVKTGNEPGVLVGSVMTFASVELWSLANIKRDEIKGEKDENKLETEIIE